MYSFGSGVLFGTRTDVANSTPVNFGLVQTVSIDETASVKELYGQFQRPVAIARGSIKTTGKATVARISATAIGNLFYGVTPQTGQLATSFAEAAVVPAATPYTVTAANAATWVQDSGVIYVATGLPFTLVSSAPTVGQYSVSAGVYTFAAADSGKAILLNYTYTIANAGLQIPVNNQLSGTTPTFSARFFTTFQGNNISLTAYNCTSSKLGFATKLEDYVIPEFDFELFANAAGNVLNWSYSEAS